MQETRNHWIHGKNREIEAVKRQLLEYAYAGSYGGSIDLLQVNRLIEGAVVEIIKLQKENESLKAQLKTDTKKDEV